MVTVCLNGGDGVGRHGCRCSLATGSLGLSRQIGSQVLVSGSHEATVRLEAMTLVGRLSVRVVDAG